jgi:recombinational DNA repair protein (RecF pathway)
MYDRYTTDALVLGSFPRGEGDKTLRLLTRDFGLVYVRGISLRAEKSKLRYATQDYARLFAELVRGKHDWRLVGAVQTGSASAASRVGLLAFARIADLVVRLVAGEDHNEYLFDAVAEAHQALLREQGTDIATVEIVCVARVLYALGYLSTEAYSTTLFSHTAYQAMHLAEAQDLKKPLISSINRALAETHLLS